MREIHLNGYIDDAEWFGDEITPESLHEMLYPPGEGAQDDLRIILNSYGGSCNAAVRMFDDLRAYPGNVHIIVSGTAASAATVLATAADRLEMTPGSLWMIHDPSVMAWGNERDLEEAIRLLRACKESILNVYWQALPKGAGRGRRHDARHDVDGRGRGACRTASLTASWTWAAGSSTLPFVMRRASPRPRPRSPRGWSAADRSASEMPTSRTGCGGPR